MSIHEFRKLLLIDGVGAFISAMFLGVVLTRIQHLVGMPEQVLIILSLIAMVMALNSYISSSLKNINHQAALRRVAIINVIYCLITLMLVIYYFGEMKAIGLAYFFLEMFIIVILVFWEWKRVQ